MTTDAGLRASQQALAMLEKMLFDLYREKDKYHPTQYFAMFAMPLVEDIRKIRREIDDQIGVTDFDLCTAAFDAARAAGTSPPANGVHAPDPAAQPA